MTTPAETLAEWIERTHARSHAQSCTAICTTWRPNPSAALPEARARAARVHDKFHHLGLPDSCQSPHDVLCKAVW